jgi:hypothetical protein
VPNQIRWRIGGSVRIRFSPVEVASYYRFRCPDLPQTRNNHWRGKCPIHRGRNLSFSVNAASGQWFCFSKCRRGGDIIELERLVTSASWRDAVKEIERIVGRNLLDRPASLSERQNLAKQRQDKQREMRSAEFFQLAAMRMAEHLLDDVLLEGVPERYAPTQLLLKLRAATGSTLLAEYHDFQSRQPQLAAALVYAGERAWRRLSLRIARFIAAGMEVPHA